MNRDNVGALLRDLASIEETVYVAGEWHEGGGGNCDVIDPTTGQLIASIALASEQQGTAALQAARTAQPGWSAIGPVQRSAHLLRIAEQLELHQDELASLISLEMGKPIGQARGELKFAISTVRFQAGLARYPIGEIVPSDIPQEIIHLTRVPLGVVAAICAWNFPVAMFFRKAAPALMAGNTIVLKPSEYTPIVTTAIARICGAAGLPAGVVNIVPGDGVLGGKLVSSPLADMVTMTGSVASGKAVLREVANGGHLPKVGLELGGKAPAIVWKDADLDLTVTSLIGARYQNTGQVCTSAERLYVHADILDEFVTRYRSAVQELQTGDPFDDPDMGPLANKNQLGKVEDIISEAYRLGATELLERQVPDKLAGTGGYWCMPSVLVGVTDAMRVLTEEVFGPVSPVIPIGSLEEAIKLANDSRQGLTSFIFSNNYRVIMEATSAIEAGTVYVNRTQGSAVQGFHSGHKESGLGGEDGRHGFLEYTQIRTVYHRMSW